MNKLLVKYPDRVPVLVESKLGDSEVFKYMVPKEKTIAEMMAQLRKHIKMSPRQAVFLFVNNTLPPNSYTVGQVWELHKNEEGVLHMYYSLENTFGYSNPRNVRPILLIANIPSPEAI
jgi:GABA(A) receptor-associated protein